jgi:hypothetical protein
VTLENVSQSQTGRHAEAPILTLMKIKWARYVVLATAVAMGLTSTAAQTHLALSREIDLPVAAERGSWGNIWGRNLPAGDQFAWSNAPGESLLVFDSDTSGNWPLIRVRKWWTDKPETDVLNLPGWNTAAFKKFMNHWYVDIHIDLQVTPDGRYAVAFAEAALAEKALIDLFRMHDLKVVTPAPDTIITVVDLEHWQIVKTIHTPSLGEMHADRARILNGGWVALDQRNFDALPGEGREIYSDRKVQLLSLPDLNPGPACARATGGRREAMITHNQRACAEVYKATGTKSDEALGALIARGGDPEPAEVRVKGDEFREREGRSRESEWDRENGGKIRENLALGEWGEYPYDRWFAEGPALESSSHLWYGLHEAPEHPFYELEAYDSGGVKRNSQTIRRLLCGDPELDAPKSACGCRVISVSEGDRTLLAYCRRASHYDTDLLQRQWLSVFRTDDFSGLGIVDIEKGSRPLQWLASGDGLAFVLTLEHGEKLRIYAIPERQAGGAP